jgi:hypothetical protein
MYIEFDLPRGSSDIQSTFSADLTLKIIQNEMLTWSKRYNIPYQEKTIKYKYRVTFEQDELYSFWAITWNAEQKYYATNRYRIVSDLNNKI